MKIGFISTCFPGLSTEEVVAWATGAGYESLEVAAWPKSGYRQSAATHLDAEDLDEAGAEEFRSLFDEHGVDICSVSFYENNLHPDPQQRRAINRHVHACIKAAAAVGAPTVGTFVGRDPSKSVKENRIEAESVFAPMVAHADDVGVKIVIENCVMQGWHPDGYPGNLAYSPELWEWMFGIGLYLNYDPSHLLWMGIDPIEALVPYVNRIRLAQAKDIELFPERRSRWGWPGKSLERDDPWDVGWWRYRVPGLGELDWRRIVQTLYEHGYDGVLSVEHEDPVLGGSDEGAKAGLAIAHRTLRPLIVRSLTRA